MRIGRFQVPSAGVLLPPALATASIALLVLAARGTIPLYLLPEQTLPVAVMALGAQPFVAAIRQGRWRLVPVCAMILLQVYPVFESLRVLNEAASVPSEAQFWFGYFTAVALIAFIVTARGYRVFALGLMMSALFAVSSSFTHEGGVAVVLITAARVAFFAAIAIVLALTVIRLRRLAGRGV